jgi:ABC-type amino acid transport system permease subunit
MSISAEGFEKVLRYAELFKQGMICTVSISALTVFFGFFLALLLAIMRLSKVGVFKLVAATYVEVIPRRRCSCSSSSST